ncbi:esterase-like activity of phytase family protein [Spirulina sp. 06S082]|uniref:esterase-like activity of phytase family protein n=1 Tax=Spirulina sp. 06S082 TaxID=3110248 RepID=UPI002B1FE175|nr:esterase-like activity of phytase family protein [Spirulina sp. 06S082]MEA5469881.1 esterase-like activity of phytase family protein [Spirulina sp. 06S082]
MYQKSLFSLILAVIVAIALSACTPSQISAQERLFLDVSLEFVGEVQLPKMEYKGTRVGGLSGITYDRDRNIFYALSDDRHNARFYTLNLTFSAEKSPRIEIKNVTFLKDKTGNPYAQGAIDPEGIALTSKGTLLISSEGIPSRKIDPFVAEFDRQTGQYLTEIPLPARFLPNQPIRKEDIPHGVQENLGFEALAIGISGLIPEDPYRIFTAPEFALVQDNIDPTPEVSPRIRLLHYVINPIGSPLLISENLYLLDPASEGVIANGLTELLALDREGFLLSLERTFDGIETGAKLFQIATGGATDTSRIATLKGDLSTVTPLRKQLLLDLQDLGIVLDNLEGMTFAGRLPDGSPSLILVSDDNFNERQVTQFLVFRFQEKP